MRSPFRVRNNEEGVPFEKQDLIGAVDLGKVGQAPLDVHHVGDQHVDDRTPSSVQGLVPNLKKDPEPLQILAAHLLTTNLFIKSHDGGKGENFCHCDML